MTNTQNSIATLMLYGRNWQPLEAKELLLSNRKMSMSGTVKNIICYHLYFFLWLTYDYCYYLINDMITFIWFGTFIVTGYY